eukprot:1132483-Alexandrium_andersonii.AAC.1
MANSRPSSLCRMAASATSVSLCMCTARTAARTQAAFRALQAGKSSQFRRRNVGADWPLDRA